MPVEAVISTRCEICGCAAAGSFPLCAKKPGTQSRSVAINSESGLPADILALWRVEPHGVVHIAEIVLHRLQLFILCELAFGVIGPMQPAIHSAEPEVGKHAHRVIMDGLLEQWNGFVRMAGFVELVGEADFCIDVVRLGSQSLLVACD